VRKGSKKYTMAENNKECIGCGRCTKVCKFLNKYGINSDEYRHMPELAYSCYLCSECVRVCPVGIDGSEISKEMRNNFIEGGGHLKGAGYKFLLMEKKDYLFKNYKNASYKSVLFTGCNFPAYFPKTTQIIASRLMNEAGIGMVADCCGKPVSELGMSDKGETIIENLEKRLQDCCAEEIITLCPNCYYYLKDRLDVRVVMIYEKLKELKMKTSPIDEDIDVFIPCPDKIDGQILEGIEGYAVRGRMKKIQGIQCCSAGGSASFMEPLITKSLLEDFSKVKKGKIYTYCATCSGMIAKSGTETEHILCRLFDSEEKSAEGISSLMNRAACKYKQII